MARNIHIGLAMVGLTFAGVIAGSTHEAEARGLNCEQLNGPPALCYEWTVESVEVGVGIFQQLCEQVPIPASAEQFCTNAIACVSNGLCDGQGGCQPNVDIEGSDTTCTLTPFAAEDGYLFCFCENYACAAVSPNTVLYPASSTWCTAE